MPKDEKLEKLKEIEELLKTYDGKMEISPYILEYLSLEELDSILLNLLKQQSNVIQENQEWLHHLSPLKK